MSELEEENNALEQEHLVMLKKQDQIIPNNASADEKEQSTMAESKGHISLEESAQIIANKKQQIDVLSNMLEQKGNHLKKQKDEFDEQMVKLKEKEK